MSVGEVEPRHGFGSGIGNPDRYKVRFRDEDSLWAAQAAESPFLDVVVRNEKRRFISISAKPVVLRGVRAEMPSIEEQLSIYEREYDAEIVIDYQYSLESGADEFDLPVTEAVPETPSLDDVLDAIKAREAWKETRGAGVTIAIVDTGVNGNRPEFPLAKRRDQWAPAGENPWLDYNGHGTMCACIATATRAEGGEFDGVAPEARLVSCRTHFYDSELTGIYDFLGDLAEQGEPMIASNSFGIATGTAPPEPADSDFPDALGEAIDRGVIVCFSAGNYHQLAGGQPDQCTPTSVWRYKCRDDVLAVAASKPDDTMWFYSSRGPGQHAGEAGMGDKPNVTAPTPPQGRVVFGDAVKSLPDGWGTSGACPQVAGLLALLASKRRAPRQELFAAVTDTTRSIGLGANCQGTGVIDCEKAVAHH